MRTFLLVFLCLTFGLATSVNAQKSKNLSRYIGNDTVRILPLTKNRLCKGQWNRLILKSVVFKNDFHPKVEVIGAQFRVEKEKPNEIWILPDTNSKLVHLRVFNPQAPSGQLLLMDMPLKTVQPPIPKIKAFINDSLEYDKIPSRELSRSQNKWRITFEWDKEYLRQCPNASVNEYKVDSVAIYIRGCFGAYPNGYAFRAGKDKDMCFLIPENGWGAKGQCMFVKLKLISKTDAVTGIKTDVTDLYKDSDFFFSVN